MSDKGHRLRISERTAENPVQHVRDKLGLRSRAQIGRWVAEPPDLQLILALMTCARR